MAALAENWLTEKHIDFEYKKYILLAYLQEVSRNFDSAKIYPWLSDLIAHYRNALEVQENKQQLKKHFPQRISGMDKSKRQLTYEAMLEDSELMQELENIIRYAIPLFEESVKEGKSLYDFVEEHLYLYPVGIVPLNASQGYMFLKEGKKADTNVFEYHITFFEKASEKYRAIHTHFVKNVSHGFTSSFESIKSDLVRENKNLPNPAAYAIEAGMAIPMEETFLPIAKRMLVKHISKKELE